MFKTLPGFREFLPEECRRRNFYFSQWRRISRNYHFQEFDGPVLEPLELYEEKSGPEIREQLFCFTDKGGREVALRPEMTPTLARLVGPRLGALRKPVKWFSIGEQYRYERYQKGRKRAFYQYNADIIGEAGPSAEVELMALLIDSLCSFGLSEKDFAVRLSDRQLWIMYLRGLGIEEARAVSVLGVVDKLGREPEDVLERKLEPLVGDRAAGLLKKMIEFSRQQSLDGVREMFRGSEIALDDLENRLADWNELLQGLQAMGLSPFVQIDLGIVRGLAYYTGFVFEAFDR
ncbi:MAG: ATP phosphoribosyltransferase regulatory subunit [Opitutales bacterium]|nr:ATP phosphoribosyltransferase regulatory subunit [Opitutales bacterium]